MRIVKAIFILVCGPLLGIVVGLVIGSIATPADPNFVKNGSHGSPGDGFLVMGCMAVSFLISVLISIALAGTVLFKSKGIGPRSEQIDPQFDPPKKRVIP